MATIPLGHRGGRAAPDAARLDARVAALRARFPRAVVDRYLDRLPTVGARGAASRRARRWSATSARATTSRSGTAPSCAAISAPVVGRAAARTSRTARCIHVADDSPCRVGAETVVGHRAMLHACRVEDGCLIGMQATILDEAVIGDGSMVGAGPWSPQRDRHPAAQPGARQPGAGGPDVDRGRRTVSSGAGREVRSPEGELPARLVALSVRRARRRASEFGTLGQHAAQLASTLAATHRIWYTAPPWKSAPCENACRSCRAA